MVVLAPFAGKPDKKWRTEPGLTWYRGGTPASQRRFMRGFVELLSLVAYFGLWIALQVCPIGVGANKFR
jgi:hypothetical protein